VGKEIKRVSDRIYRIDRMAGRGCLKCAKVTKIGGKACTPGVED